MRMIDADALLRAYDEAHEGPPGKARKLIEDAPTVYQWRSMATFGPPKEAGWYLVYAPDYTGGYSKEHINGCMFAQWDGKTWSAERYGYQRKGCVKAWMPLSEPPKDGEVE